MVKCASICALLLAATIPAPALATPVYSCIAEDGTVSYTSQPAAGLDCQEIAALPAADWSMVYQDQDLSVLAATEDLDTRQTTVRVWLRTAYTQPQRRPSIPASFQSTLRQMEFNCTARTQIELEERAYAERHARGTLVATVRRSNAAATAIARGSRDDAVLGAICGQRAG